MTSLEDITTYLLDRSTLLWSFAALVCMTSIHFYYKHKFSFWSNRGIKTPPPIPIFGTSLYPVFTPKPILELQLHRTYGKLYGHVDTDHNHCESFHRRLYEGFLGTKPTLVCGHPEAIKQVTIKHFHSFTNRRRPNTYKSIRYRALTYMMDDEWKQVRCLLAPIFTSNKLKRMFELMKRCTNNLKDAIAKQSDQEIELKKLFAVFTVDVISTCCFSMDLKEYRHPDSEILSSARKFFEVSKFKMACAFSLPKSLLGLIGFDINDTSSIDFFARFTTEIIAKRRRLLEQMAKGQTKCNRPDDFLQILLDVINEKKQQNKSNNNNNNDSSNISNNNHHRINKSLINSKSSYQAIDNDNQQTKQESQEEVVPVDRCDDKSINDRMVVKNINQQQAQQSTGETSATTIKTNREEQQLLLHNQRQSTLASTHYSIYDSVAYNNYHTAQSQSQSQPQSQSQQQQSQAQLKSLAVNVSSKPVINDALQQLGDLEILAQSMLFFAVGHETTATLLSTCGFFLALNLDMQARLYEEVHQAFIDDEGDISYDKLLELEYLDAFISEALRIYTPTLTFDREASEDVELEIEGKRLIIPKGMGIIIPFHAIHHDPDNYDDPEKFDPDRFMPENKHKIKPCTYIPFGSGPRYCLAMRFALIEAKLALAHLIHKYQFVKTENTIWPPKFRHHYMLLQMVWPKIKFVERQTIVAASC